MLHAGYSSEGLGYILSFAGWSFAIVALLVVPVLVQHWSPQASKPHIMACIHTCIRLPLEKASQSVIFVMFVMCPLAYSVNNPNIFIELQN